MDSDQIKIKLIWTLKVITFKNRKRNQIFQKAPLNRSLIQITLKTEQIEFKIMMDRLNKGKQSMRCLKEYIWAHKVISNCSIRTKRILVYKIYKSKSGSSKLSDQFYPAK